MIKLQEIVSPEDAYEDAARGVSLVHGDSTGILKELADKHPGGVFDCIITDPPYFLSNGGITCSSGKMVRVDKGGWDVSMGHQKNHEFNLNWLRLCKNTLKPNGTIWVSGTHHVIFSVGFAMQELGFKILNDIAWEKPNPPPNLSCRYFTHSTETLLWAARDQKSRHYFDYDQMRAVNGGRQMKTVWNFKAPDRAEKLLGKHPTQKPLKLIERCIIASTREGDLVCDPFMGSGTTAVAAMALQRKFFGVEMDGRYFELAKARVGETGGQP